jgi:hypothetical protein
MSDFLRWEVGLRHPEKMTALTTLSGEPHGFLSSRRDLFLILGSGWFTHIKLYAAPD